jgi:GNAT superfamily N-acetyltransferase
MTVLAPPFRPAGAIPIGPQRWVTIRAIESTDRDGLFDFYRRLSPDARRARFLGSGAVMSRRAADRFSTVDHRLGDGLVAILGEAGPLDGQIVGHLCLEPEDAVSEELAVAVADGLRGHGIGSALMREAVASARRRHVPRLHATLLAANVPMRRLLLDAGLPVMADHLEAGVESIELGTEPAPRRQAVQLLDGAS